MDKREKIARTILYLSMAFALIAISVFKDAGVLTAGAGVLIFLTINLWTQ